MSTLRPDGRATDEQVKEVRGYIALGRDHPHRQMRLERELEMDVLAPINPAQLPKDSPPPPGAIDFGRGGVPGWPHWRFAHPVRMHVLNQILEYDGEAYHANQLLNQLSLYSFDGAFIAAHILVKVGETYMKWGPFAEQHCFVVPTDAVRTKAVLLGRDDVEATYLPEYHLVVVDGRPYSFSQALALAVGSSAYDSAATKAYLDERGIDLAAQAWHLPDYNCSAHKLNELRFKVSKAGFVVWARHLALIGKHFGRLREAAQLLIKWAQGVNSSHRDYTTLQRHAACWAEFLELSLPEFLLQLVPDVGSVQDMAFAAARLLHILEPFCAISLQLSHLLPRHLLRALSQKMADAIASGLISAVLQASKNMALTACLVCGSENIKMMLASALNLALIRFGPEVVLERGVTRIPITICAGGMVSAELQAAFHGLGLVMTRHLLAFETSGGPIPALVRIVLDSVDRSKLGAVPALPLDAGINAAIYELLFMDMKVMPLAAENGQILPLRIGGPGMQLRVASGFLSGVAGAEPHSEKARCAAAALLAAVKEHGNLTVAEMLSKAAALADGIGASPAAAAMMEAAKTGSFLQASTGEEQRPGTLQVLQPLLEAAAAAAAAPSMAAQQAAQGVAEQEDDSLAKRPIQQLKASGDLTRSPPAKQPRAAYAVQAAAGSQATEGLAGLGKVAPMTAAGAAGVGSPLRQPTAELAGASGGLGGAGQASSSSMAAGIGRPASWPGLGAGQVRSSSTAGAGRPVSWGGLGAGQVRISSNAGAGRPVSWGGLGTGGGSGAAGSSLGAAGGSLGAAGSSLGAAGGSAGHAGGSLGAAGGSLVAAGGSLGAAGGGRPTGGSAAGSGGAADEPPPRPDGASWTHVVRWPGPVPGHAPYSGVVMKDRDGIWTHYKGSRWVAVNTDPRARIRRVGGPR
ncbi:hypothetical protein ABPG75_008143 [Micractinium tetrahymenae]